MVLRLMLHKTQCIFDAMIGYFAGGHQEKFYPIFTAMMLIVASSICFKKNKFVTKQVHAPNSGSVSTYVV